MFLVILFAGKLCGQFFPQRTLYPCLEGINRLFMEIPWHHSTLPSAR